MSNIMTPDNKLAALEMRVWRAGRVEQIGMGPWVEWRRFGAAGKCNRLYQYPGQEGENLRSNLSKNVT